MTNAIQPTTTEIRDKIMQLDNLPPFPAMASKIMSECQKPEATADSVAKLIECEPAVCSKVIQLANSPLFATSRPIASIGHSIVLLGFNTVSQMAISIAAGRLFSGGNHPDVTKHRKQAFRQSLACAVASRTFAKQLGSVNTDEAFLCGILHDVGKLVLFDVVPEQYCKLLDDANSPDTTAVEHEAFGVCHPVLGMTCGLRWGFPFPLNGAIQQHHKSLDDAESELAKAVIAGSYYAHLWEIAEPGMFVQPELPEIETAFSAYQLDELQDQCRDQFEAVIEICTA